MLDVKRVLKSAVAPKRGEPLPLSTPWGAALDPDRILPEHPRPTMVRDRYAMLNGPWEYAVRPLEGALAGVRAERPLSPAEATEVVCGAQAPDAFEGTILVPFSPEAPLSGVGRTLRPDELLWYRRRFPAPARAAGERLIVHFEAVDWACAVFVDGRLAAAHTGGSLPFDVDITPHLGDAPEGGGQVELSLCVYDPNSAGVQLRGKQSLDPGGIWYTAQSGIWQSVWYEVVPAAHLTQATLTGDAQGVLLLDLGYTAPAACVVDAVVLDAQGMERARGRWSAPAAAEGSVHGTILVDHPALWSPDDPALYTVWLSLAAPGDADGMGTIDRVESYCAFRTVEVAADGAGTPRFLLNGEPLFLRGALDQGYWPDGLMTAPSDEALVHDIEEARRLGFNMLRKHIKVESARWYYHADRLGMLVWQDVPSGGGAYSAWWTSRIPTLFSVSWGLLDDREPGTQRRLSGEDEDYQREWTDTGTEMVKRLSGHPSIAAWTLFNEGWGQFDAVAAAERVHALDPTRPIDATSGWYDQRCGDFLSIHNYFRPLSVARDTGARQGYAAQRDGRAVMLSEFGGLTQLVAGHSSTETAYGYGNFDTLEEWRAAVRAALAEAEALEGAGLAGYVYTQLSDVEDELNGLLTYDRRVTKL